MFDVPPGRSHSFASPRGARPPLRGLGGRPDVPPGLLTLESTVKSPDPRVIVALDFANPMGALALADKLDPAACALKVGKETFVVAGRQPVRWMIERGFRVFLDLSSTTFRTPLPRLAPPRRGSASGC